MCFQILNPNRKSQSTLSGSRKKKTKTNGDGRLTKNQTQRSNNLISTKLLKSNLKFNKTKIHSQRPPNRQLMTTSHPQIVDETVTCRNEFKF